MRRVTAAALFCLLTGAAPSLTAQNLRGAVSDSASREPISGAVVMLLDSAGAVLGRNITDENGRYRLALSGTARLARIVRIGFQPREIRVQPAADHEISLDVSMVRVPTMLASVRVRSESHCSRRSDREAAFGLWDQARAGLLATVVAQETKRASVHLFMFVRSMDANTDRITHLHVETDFVDGAAKSFNTARSAKDFVKSGFSADSGDVQTIFGPDAEVLLDDAFASAYCFRIAAPVKTRPNQVGLAFAPWTTPDGRVDIDGTLWIDTATRALSDIEFRYIGLPGHTDQFNPGGRVSFHQMSNGVVLIDRWYLRGVAAGIDSAYIGPFARRRRELFATESGGELASAVWPDGQRWHASLGTVRVHAVTASGKPAAGAGIGLPDTPYRGTTDSTGTAAIVDLVPGPYTVGVIDPRVSALGIWIPTAGAFLAARDSTVELTLKVPSAEEFTIGRCVDAKQWTVGDSVFILGRVVTARGAPVTDAKVTFSVQTKTGQWNLLDKFYTTGADGVFQSCSQSFALGASVLIKVERPGHEDEAGITTLATKLTIIPIPVAP